MAGQFTDGNANATEPMPFWLPTGVALVDLSEELRAAVVGILTPAYQKLVVAARPGLEQSTGTTIVNLLWLEILQQVELGRDLMKGGLEPERLELSEKSIARLLRVGGSKLKASDFLLRLGAGRRKLMGRLGVAWAPKDATPAADGQSSTTSERP